MRPNTTKLARAAISSAKRLPRTPEPCFRTPRSRRAGPSNYVERIGNIRALSRSTAYPDRQAAPVDESRSRGCWGFFGFNPFWFCQFGMLWCRCVPTASRGCAGLSEARGSFGLYWESLNFRVAYFVCNLFLLFVVSF